ncbi:MAG: TonB-dependent receptor [Acidobacteria bacterium]|nr:TonB-dependent receptor [Acidobacteriota bacterium]
MRHKHSLVVMFCFAASLAFGQSDQARIGGTVTDSAGAIVPGAAVVVKNEKTGSERSASANAEGHYLVTNLPPAQYTVAGKAPGLGPTTVSRITLTAGQERAVNLLLEPAALQQQITISGGELMVVDTSSARIGGNVNEREVATLPLNGRQLSQLYLLVPGAQTAGGGSFDNIRFSGRANQQNAIRFDGVEASSIIDASPGNLNGETSTGFRLQTSLENVQEFRVESSNYPAEYGTGTAGQISVVTKSGSNEFHGAVFEYIRNNAMDARNFFDGSDTSPLRLNQFGGSLGGPIVRNKLFFFGNYEGLRQRAGVNILEAVPSAAARARAVPSIAPLMAAYPAGGTPTSNPDLNLYRLSSSSAMDENYGSLRFDYRISDKYSLAARYFRDQGELTSPLNVTGNYQRVSAVPQNAMVSLQQILSPSAINETKAGLNAYKSRINGVAPNLNGIDLSAVSVDFTGTATIAGIGGQGVSGGAARIGGLVRSNSAQNGRAVPYTNYTLTFADQLSIIRNDHSFKFGVEVRPIRLYTDRLGGTTYTFSNLNDLLNNSPGRVEVIGDVSAPNPLHGGATGNRFLKQTYYIGYAQDEWKIRPNLTMNYGVRYEYYSVLHEDRNLFTLFDMNTATLQGPDTPWYSSSKLNFGPRLAFTWAPARFKDNTVLRIGAGYYYGPGQTEDQVQPIDSDRVTVTAANAVFPVQSQQIISSFDTNHMKGFAPRVYAPGYTLPEKILSYTASIQQRLPFDTVLTAAYVGSQGRNLFLRAWTNVMTGVAMNPASGAGLPVLEFGDRFAQLDYKTSGGTDHYDSLQVTANRRFSKGLTIGSQWTWGHSIGNTGGSNEAQTQASPFDFSLDRGNNAFDVRHNFNASAMYELPFGKGRKYLSGGNSATEFLLGGWEIGGVVNARTGLPIDVTLARNDVAYRVNSTGAIVDKPIAASGGTILTTPLVNNPWGGAFRNNRRPDVVPGVSPYLSSTADKRVFLNPAAFAIPAPGTFGNLGRWALHGPGLSQFDLTLHKRFRVNERVNIEFRSEIYNILNHTNFKNPVSRLNNALGTGRNQVQPGESFTAAAAGGTFGLATSTVTKGVGLGTSRQVQLALRLNF